MTATRSSPSFEWAKWMLGKSYRWKIPNSWPKRDILFFGLLSFLQVFWCQFTAIGKLVRQKKRPSPLRQKQRTRFKNILGVLDWLGEQKAQTPAIRSRKQGLWLENKKEPQAWCIGAPKHSTHVCAEEGAREWHSWDNPLNSSFAVTIWPDNNYVEVGEEKSQPGQRARSAY